MSKISVKKLPHYLKRIKSEIREKIFLFNLRMVKNNNCKYSSVSVEDITYFFQINDTYIPKKMFVTGKNFAEDEINKFFRWTEQYYGICAEEVNGVFLDIGANIGTTCIYVWKNYPNLHCIAFEPDEENYKCLTANCCMNLAVDISTVHYGLSNEKKKTKMRQFDKNRGKNYIIYDDSPKQNDLGLETIETTTLDLYFEENNLDINDVSFIWIDTEGFEPYVIDGAMKVLQNKKTPLWMEFSGKTLREHKASFELLKKNLSTIYSKAKYCKGGIDREVEIDNLEELLAIDGNIDLFLY